MKARFRSMSIAFAILLAACSPGGDTTIGDREVGSGVAAQDVVPTADGNAVVIVDNDVKQIFTYIPMGVYESVPPVEGTDAGTRCLTVFGTLEVQATGEASGFTAPLPGGITVAGDGVGPELNCVGVLEELGPLGYSPLSEIEVVVGATAGFYVSFGDSEGQIDTVGAQAWTGSTDSVAVELTDPPRLEPAESTTAGRAAPLGSEYRYGDFWTVRPQQIVEVPGGAASMTCYAVTAIASVAPYETNGPPEWSDDATDLGMVANGAYFSQLGASTNIESFAWQFGSALENPRPPPCDTDALSALGWQPKPASIEFDTGVPYFDVLHAPEWIEPEQLVVGLTWIPGAGLFDFDVAAELEPPPSS